MEAVYEIGTYFPLRVSDPTLSKYIAHHSEHLHKCVENELYSSAYQHLHILYMVFIYIQLLRISKEKKQEFDYCWIGFPREEKDFLREPTSPFSFSKINEKTVFRFFRLLGFDDGSICEISGLVNKRNKHLHANGEIFYEDEEALEKELNIYMKIIEKIITKQRTFLNALYSSIISDFDDDYEVTYDDLETSFASPYYFSEFELKILAQDKRDIFSKFINDEDSF